MKTIVLMIALVMLGGCASPHNPFIIANTTGGQLLSTNKYASHTNKVFVTEHSLPASARYEPLEIIEVGKIWYGTGRNVKQSLGDRARAIGADAVVEVKLWHQPSGWSWAAPHGSGKAIKISESGTQDVSTLPGEWF